MPVRSIRGAEALVAGSGDGKFTSRVVMTALQHHLEDSVDLSVDDLHRLGLLRLI
jgi:hypothetical protein